jgi:RING finger family protein
VTDPDTNQRLMETPDASAERASGLELKPRSSGPDCPLCWEAFGGDEEVGHCPHCKTVHHRECFLEFKGCATLGCHGAGRRLRSEPPSSSSGREHDPAPLRIRKAPHCSSPSGSELGITGFVMMIALQLIPAFLPRDPSGKQVSIGVGVPLLCLILVVAAVWGVDALERRLG